MKRLLASLIVILPLLGLFSSSEIYAQPKDGVLPGTKPPATPGGAGSKSGSSGPVTPILAFGMERKGRLDPKTSDKAPDGSFFEDMILKAESEDSLSFRVMSNDASLGLQIIGKNNAEVAIRKDPSGDFKIATPTGGLPANGDYRVRVTGARGGKSAIPFTIKVDRLGLTASAYAERFKRIYDNYNENNPASVDETIAKLERLVKEAPNHSTAFERLGIIYLEIRKDTVKAEWAMDRAIKTNGVALIKISYDNKWRPMAKLRSGELGFEDKRVGWLRIQAGILTLHDASMKPLVTVTRQQIKEVSRTMVSAYNLVTIAANNSRKFYTFAPEAMRQVEADLVVKLVQNHVVGKAY